MKTVTVYSTGTCPWCVQAESLLSREGVTPEKIRVDESPEQMAEMISRTGKRTVPQIFIGNHHVGGYTDLHDLVQQGQLQHLLNS